MQPAKKAIRFKRIDSLNRHPNFFHSLLIWPLILLSHAQSHATEPSPCSAEILKKLHSLQAGTPDSPSALEALTKSTSRGVPWDPSVVDFYKTYPTAARLSDLHLEANTAKLQLTKARASLRESRELPYVGLMTEDAEFEILGTDARKTLSDQLKGTVLAVDKLPSATKKFNSQTPALFHPEMAAYKKRLEELGYELVVDQSLGLTSLSAYVEPTGKVLALESSTSWAIFKHEFQHVEFNTYIKKHFNQATIAVNEGKNLSDVLPKETLAAIPSKRIDELEKLIKKGLPELATNETLSVQEELKAMGFRAYLPGRGALARYYAYYHQTEGLLDLQESGEPLTLIQQKTYASALRKKKMLEPLTSWETPLLVAGATTTVGVIAAAPTVTKKVEELKQNQDQILKDLFGEFIFRRIKIIFYKDDGALVGVTDDGTFVSPQKNDNKN